MFLGARRVRRIMNRNQNPTNITHVVYGQPPNYGSQSPPPNRPKEPIMNVIDGIMIKNEYQPQKGEPVIIQQAISKGQVVKMGDKRKEVINDNQAILIGEGFASEDGKHWKHIPKITLNVFKIGQLEIREITKVKARYEATLQHHKIMKITVKEKDYFLAFKENTFNQWFLRLVWSKLILQKRECSQFGEWQPKMGGKLYKKSFVMGDWQPRCVEIDQRSLRASKDNKSAPNLQIEGTKQIWTRFEQIQGGYYLVVKLWNGFMKEQFAVPTAFCLNWLHHFLGLLIVK